MTTPGSRPSADWYRSADTGPGYACVLDEQPGWACPGGHPSGRPGNHPDGDVLPAPGLAISDTGALGLGAGFRPGPVAVTGDHGALPFWLGRDGCAAVRALLDGRTLPAPWRDLLVAADLAVRPGTEPPRPTSRPVGAHARVLRGLVHPFHLGALRLHTRRLLRTGAMRNGDGQTPLRWVQHNEPVASWVHGHLAGAVSTALGTPVTPSYVYTSTYHDGADLPVHVDRPQCRHTVSLAVDCLPETPDGIPWPLVLEPPGSRLRIYQRLGDGVLYDGTRIPHRRPPMPPGLVVTAMFFHFVPAGYTGPLG